MMSNLKTLAFSVIMSSAVVSTTAEARGFEVSYATGGRHGSFALKYRSGFERRFHGTPFQKSSYLRKARHSACASVWVPGRHETVYREVWVKPGFRRKFVEPIFETHFDECGVPYRVQIGRGYWTRVHVPGHFETREVKVWRPAYRKKICHH